jgi:DedD protein
MAEAPELNVDELRRRARRRLVGAVVLALAAAVLVPMLLESDPKPLGDDVSVRIPPVDDGKFVNRLTEKGKGDAARPSASRAEPARDAAKAETPPSAVVPAKGDAAPKSGPPAKNETPAKSEAPTKGETPSKGETPAKGAAPAKTESPATSEPAAVSATPRKTLAQAEQKVLAASSTAAPAASAPPPAAAPNPAAASAPPPAASADVAAGAFSVQLAAFADDKGANALANKLKRGGYPAYTEPLTTSKGTLWRVRVGPYSSRDAAIEVRNKLKGEGYSGIVASK